MGELPFMLNHLCRQLGFLLAIQQDATSANESQLATAGLEFMVWRPVKGGLPSNIFCFAVYLGRQGVFQVRHHARA